MKKVIALILVLAIIFGGLYLGLNLLKGGGFSGNSATSTLFDGFNFISENNLVPKEDFDRIDGQYYLSYDYIKENIDSDIKFSNNTVVFNNSVGMREYKVNEKIGYVNGEGIELRDPVIEKDGKILVPIEGFIYDYPVDFRYVEENNLLILDFTNKEHQLGSPSGNGTNMRESNSTASPIVKKVGPEDLMYVYDNADGWYQVRLKDGYLGYIREDLLEKIGSESALNKIERVSNRPLNLVWDYTYGPQSDESVANIRYINGVNVICPTWFSIKDGTGEVVDRGRKDYVEKYNALGIDVWAYLDNSFDPDITHDALSNPESRKYTIDRLINLCKKYGLKGVNIDFEQYRIDDRDNVTAFMEELYPRLKEEGLIVSIDVTPQISKDVAKEPYDRAKLALYSDYVIVMTYDQHWGSSEKAGSVAQYKWVEGNLNNLFRSIPKEKLVLGMPLYSRYWTTKDGNTSSKTVSMAQVNEIISTRGLTPTWDEESKQKYIEFEDNGALKQIWIEDGESLKWKTTLCLKYNLSGVASWRKGFETMDVWDTIDTVLNKVLYINK